ncbi:MAG: NAD(P)-binding domain-containing protein, partial [Chitinophagaceae bacterium]|nr:NAD(P)-binding domain-containing protein [Chitinophagaceae bacterium]
MATQQTIAIIGALEEAAQSAITALSGSGYRLLLFCKQDDPSRLSAFAAGKQFGGADVEWMSCPIEASWEADIILLSVPADEITDVATAIRQVAIGKPVVDIRNSVAARDKLKE